MIRKGLTRTDTTNMTAGDILKTSGFFYACTRRMGMPYLRPTAAITPTRPSSRIGIGSVGLTRWPAQR